MKKALLFLSIFLLLSCDKNGPTEFGFVLTDVSFVAGKHYTYAWTFETRDSLGNLLSVLHDTIAVVVETKDDIIDTLVGLTRLRAYSLVDSIGSTIVWYRNNQSSCSEVAYSGAGHVPPVSPRKSSISDQATMNRSLILFLPMTLQQMLPGMFQFQTDSTIIRQDPRVVYMYPMSQGDSWTSFTSPFLQTREVVGSESIQTGVGSRYCAKIKTASPMFAGSIEWFDYVDEQGLMLRSLTMEMLASGPEGPEPTGMITVLERAELLSITQ